MGAARAVQEVDIGVDGQARAGEADRDLPLHVVEVQRLLHFLPADDLHRIARSGREEHFGLDPGDLDVACVGQLGGQGAIAHPEGIGVEGRALMALHDLFDDAVEAHLAVLLIPTGDQDEIVQVEILVADPHPEVEGSAVARAEYDAHWGGVRHGGLRRRRW